MTASRPKPKREQDRAYRAWIGLLPCVACACEGRTTVGADCAHISFLGDRGLGSKVSDRLTAPLCRLHHDEQHKGNERLFWARLGVDPRRLTGFLSDAYPDQDIARAVIASFAQESKQPHRLIPATAMADRKDPTPAAPLQVTLTANVTTAVDGFGNRVVVLPTLGVRGLGTSVAHVAPEALGEPF